MGRLIPELSHERYKQKVLGEVRARDAQDESLRVQREEFCRLLHEECKFPREEAEASYDVRRSLMLIKSNYDWRGDISREDFLLVLDFVKEMLRHEGRRGYIPFIVRRIRKHEEGGDRAFAVLGQHPLMICQDLCTARFVVYDEDGSPKRREIGYPEEEGRLLAEDMRRALDFCMTIHAVNTTYFRTHPRVGVMQTGELSESHESQKTREANYLSWWRLLPFRICQELFESKAVDVLDELQRNNFIEEILHMCLEELFDKDYFHKRIREKPTRGIDADQLLRIIIGEYGETAPMRALRDQLKSAPGTKYSKTSEQRAYLAELFV